ncbi:hypothetical protein ALQ65_02725, partial [Pseudomonas syringae pv. coriandricola]
QPSLTSHSALSVLSGLKSTSKAVWLQLTVVPMLRVGMQFVTLRVRQRFCSVSDVGLRLEAPFRPSA